MSPNRDLLLEIGTEELPPKALKRMSKALADGIRKGLESNALGRTRPVGRPVMLAMFGLQVCIEDRNLMALDLHDRAQERAR